MKAPAQPHLEENYVLAIDPASNKCGVSLWKDGAFVAGIDLESNSARDPFSIRLQTISFQLDLFLRGQLGENEKIRTVVCEGVRSVLVQICVGALLVCPQIEAKITTASFVHSTSWKKWAKDRGATGPLKDIKGVQALRESTKDYHHVTSDDVADSILIYLTWVSKQ